jgi:translation initiation factor 4A
MTDNEEFITPSDDVKVYETFDDMNLSEELLRGVYSHGFTKPSQIQTKGIMPMLEGRDLIAQAQSGTGKTGTFVIGSLSRVDPTLKKPQVLILVHVRELAQQIAKVATAIGSFMKVKVLCAVGGDSVRENVSALDQGAQFVVGTPGRIFDLINRNALDRSQIRVLIMDEADQMLQELFFEQVMCILDKGFPAQTRVALFSATMPESVRTVASKILNDPVRILIPPSAVALNGIEQYYIDVEREDFKFECIADLYKNLNIAQAVIFCNTRKTAEKLTEKMTAHGFPVSCVHGELEKPERERRMKQFIGGENRVMIATDMIARGIDVQQISLVMNYELPQNHETYIHRIGRAGRFGRKGVTINILLPEEVQTMKDIAEKFSIVLKETPSDLSMLL